jgi:hypothetical protein
MNEVPKLLIFRQKTAKKGQMENGQNGPRNQTYLQSMDRVENHQLRPMTDVKLTTKTIIFQ